MREVTNAKDFDHNLLQSYDTENVDIFGGFDVRVIDNHLFGDSDDETFLWNKKIRSTVANFLLRAIH